jgi:hypothetical protein
MAIEKIEKAEWGPFLDGLSALLEGQRAEIEVASLKVGDQIEAEWLPVIGVVYDRKDDLVEVALEGVDHLIYHPQEIYIDHGPGGVISLEIVDGSGARQIVKFKEPLMLPAPDEVQQAS